MAKRWANGMWRGSIDNELRPGASRRRFRDTYGPGEASVVDLTAWHGHDLLTGRLPTFS